MTVHVGIGYDILHEHPNCDGAALGWASYRDFLIFANTVERLGRRRRAELRFGDHGSGSVSEGACHGAQCRAEEVVAALRPLSSTSCRFKAIIRRELPKTDPGYYFRPHKTMLVRTVADGGESFYFCGAHRATFPALRRAILNEAGA